MLLLFKVVPLMRLNKPKDSVNDYLAFCEERGEKPDKPSSGKFNLRISPVLHARLDLKAKSSRESLNSFVAKTLEKTVGE